MCSLEKTWGNDMIVLYHCLYTYFALKHNIEVPWPFDLEPSDQSNKEIKKSVGHFNGDCKVVTLFKCSNQFTHCYVLLTINPTLKLAVIYDCTAVGTKQVETSLKKNIFHYLQNNKFIPNNSQIGVVKWPNRSTRRSAQENTIQFEVKWAPNTELIKMGFETIDGNQDNCSTPIVCQQLKRIMNLKFDMESVNFKPCITTCSRWTTMNEIVFLLNHAIDNNDITISQSLCKIED
jgi:hypothetical protein